MIQVGTSVPWVCVKQELSSSSGNFQHFLAQALFTLHKNLLVKNCVFPAAY